MKQVQVTHPHLRAYRDPIVLKTGEEVTVGHEDTDYPGWIWCTSLRGKSGWVPKSILDFSLDGKAGRAFEDYDATELTVERGDSITVLDEESGWYRCENAEGKRGWVPKGNVSE